MHDDSEISVSIIIPTYYRNEELQRTIKSALNQSHEPVEVIVVDDSGERHAESVVRRYDVTYIAHDENLGANAARNTGIDRTTGDFIQFLDDDDVLDEHKISKQVALLRSSDDVGVVYCGVVHDNGERTLPDPDARGDVLRRALAFKMSPCMNSTMLLGRDVIEEVSPLTRRPSADDLGLIIELALITEFDFVDEPLVLKALKQGSRGQGVTNAKERLRIIDEYSHLYNRFTPRLRDKVLSETYYRLSAHTLNERVWSATSVWAYWKAFTRDPDPGVGRFIGCLVVLSGRPGKSVAGKLRRLLGS